MNKYLLFIVMVVTASAAKGQSAKIRAYDSVITKDAVAYRGFFTVYSVRDSFFFEIPDSIFNQDMMLINQVVKSPAQSKEPTIIPGGLGGDKLPGEIVDGSQLIFFDHARDNIINLCSDKPLEWADPGSRIGQAFKNASSYPILQDFPIIAIDKKRQSFVIDATGFLKDGNLLFGTSGSRSTHMEYFRAYPTNMEFGVYQVIGAEGNAGKVYVNNISLIAMPRTPMQPRLQDRRLGYFPTGTPLTGSSYYTDKQQGVEKMDFVPRWRLEPRAEDTKRWKRGELVEPAKQIVYYIDPATPKQWVKYLILGVNDWQKAFEQAGFKNAIIAKEWPEGSTADMHDARFSFLCYLPSATPNAYGPHVSDLRSGEIINAHVGWYHNVMTILNGWYKSQAGALDPQARKLKMDDELMGQLIRFVSSHEVGHTLGLLHNHGASSQTPVEKMRDKEWLKKHGHTVSIMDYARFNYVAQPEDSIPQENLWPHIGEYDRWAIQWGYKYIGAATPWEDKLIMGRLATDSLSSNPRLWFGNEEMEVLPYTNLLANDPRVQSECLGDNNMTAASYGIRNFKRMLSTLPTWSHEDNGQYEEMAEVYRWMKDQFRRFTVQAQAHIGGRERTYKSEETQGDVYAPTPKALQKQALAFLNDELFITPTWLNDPDILNKIVMPANVDAVSDLQIKALKRLMDVVAISRLNENVRLFGPDAAYPLEEYFSDLHGYIWSALKTHQPMDVNRRNLQKHYINDMSLIMMGPNSNIRETDCWSLARQDLIRVQNEIELALPSYSNGPDRDHLESILLRLKRTFKLFRQTSL